MLYNSNFYFSSMLITHNFFITVFHSVASFCENTKHLNCLLSLIVQNLILHYLTNDVVLALKIQISNL